MEPGSEPSTLYQMRVQGRPVAVAVVRPEQLSAWRRDRSDATWLTAEEVGGLGGVHPRARADRLAGRLALKLLVTADPSFADLELSSISLAPVQRGRPPLQITGQSRAQPSVSVAHAGGWGAAALAWGGLVGVDVELAGRRPGGVRKRLLGPGEQANSDDDVLRLWVLKEAAVKAWGAGIDLPLRDVSIRAEDGDDVALLMPDAARGWDPAASLSGRGRLIRLPAVCLGVAHFLTEPHDF